MHINFKIWTQEINKGTILRITFSVNWNSVLCKLRGTVATFIYIWLGQHVSDIVEHTIQDKSINKQRHSEGVA
jgi:hypothetical protein